MRGKKCIIILFQAILLLSTFPTIQSDFATAYETTTAENTNEAFVLNSTYPTIKILDSSSGAPRPVSSIEAWKHITEKKLIFYINDEPQYDEAGYPIQEKMAKILISKDQLIDYFGDISDIALNYAFKVYNETTWEIDVPDITNTEIIIKKFTEPELGTKWFTRGSNSSIRFGTRPMYIEIASIDDRGFNLSISHPVCNDGQIVYINKTWLRSKNITNPYFEWGERVPWKPLGYKNMGGYYVLNPKHFSIIGLHEARSGTTYGLIQSDFPTDKCYDEFIIHNDTYIHSKYPDHNYDGQNSLYLLEKTDWIGRRRILVDYPVVDNINLSLILTDFDSAELRLKCYSVTDYGPIEQKDIYAITEDWSSESVTWNNQPSHGADVLDSNTNGGTGWHTWDISANFFYQTSVPTSRYGWFIRAPEATSDLFSYRAYECGTDVPRVRVYYDGKKKIEISRYAGVNSERNIYSDTLSQDYSGNVVLKIPVSTHVTGITEVLNQITMTSATEVTSMDALTSNTFYFDAANHFVYIGTTDLVAGQNINWSINCTYGGLFALSLPKYLRSGDYFMSRGLIKDVDGNPISGLVATTTIYNQSGVSLLSVQWNCSSGNYQATIATNTLTPGMYNVKVSFCDPSTGVTFQTGSILYLDIPISGGSGDGNDIFASAYLYYTVFDQNTGAKLEDDFYKFYISSDTSIDEYDRVMGGKYPVVLGQTYYIQIRDYWNNKIYPTDSDYDEVFIDRAEFYYDVGIPFNQFLVKNSNDSIIYFRMTNGPLDDPGNTWYARWIPPYESAELFVRSGTYNISIQYYDPETRQLLKTVNITNFVIDQDVFYWIPGYKIGDIIIAVWNTNSSILNQIINIGVYVKNVNSSIINQIVNSTYLVENINTSIRYQTSVIQMMLNNTESNITNQINVMQQEIDNHLTNITNQVNHMWQSVNNTNTSIINQLNAVWQEVNNTNTTLVNQVNMIMQQIINYLDLWSSRATLPGTVRYWTFDNKSFKDNKGNDPITTNNVSFSNEGKYGGAAQFSGEESYICAANGFNLSNGTVELWIKTNFGNEKDRGIVNKSEVFSIEYNATDQKLIGTVGHPSVHVEAPFAPDNQWHHIALTWQRLWNDTNSNWDTLVRMYVDGTLVDQSETSSELTFNSTEPLYIGCTDTSHSWKGLLDELFIYNRALTGDEIYYRYAGFSPVTQWNVILQDIDNTNASIRTQINHLSQNISNTNASIHNQLNGIEQLINNTNSTIHSQLNIIVQEVNNANASIHAQLNTINQEIQNLNSTVEYQYNALSQKIVNFETNITGQVNSVWFAVNNTNTSIHQQLNLISADIYNMNASIHTQINALSTQIQNMESNITDQTNLIAIKIDNMESNITNQINGVNITIMNHNTSVMNQLNAILSQIINTNTSIIDQVNLIWNAVNNTNSTIHMQMNAIQNDINNANSTIHTQLNVISTQITNTESNITEQLNTINIKISNTETNITNQINSVNMTIINHNTSVMDQLNAILSQIVNTNTSIIDQVNLIWNAVNNTNSTIHMQMNAIQNDINNANSTIHTQLNVISTQIINTESNITEQLNNINIKISNTESNITNQLNSVNITITNHNTSVMNQLNAILSQIINTNTSIIDQVNLIWNAVNNTNSTIHMQMNAIQNDINNANSTIHTQLNVISTQITNTESNITEQLNTINIKISNTESNITNQINGVNITITNHNTSVMNQINAIMNAIVNTNATIIDQINLIWNAVNNTNSSIQTQINGVHTTITTFWSDVNYSFTVIQSDISYHNTTIVNLIDDMNASLYAQLVNVLDNVSESGESVFDKTMEILEKMGNLTGNLTLNDRLINILDNISDARVQILNKTIDILDKMGNLSSNTTLNDRLLSILDNISETRIQILNKTLDILSKMGNLSSNNTLNDRLLDILDNISDTRIQILNKTLDILALLGDKINNQTISDALWDVLENITTMQQQMAQNFSYIEQVNVNLTNETLEMLDQIYNALLDVNATAMKDLYTLLEDVLRQFKLPHEWRLPQVNYTLEDKTPPVTTISAEITINSEIRVTWSSVDNVPLNVAYVDLYYKVENASYWKEWKLHQPATGTLIFREEEPIEGKTYQFMALGTDSSGNKENQTDANTCSITYKQFVLPVSGLPTNPVQAALQDIQTILLIVALIILALIALLIYMRRERQNA